MPIKEFHLDKLLVELDMDQEKFIDLCILLGCDYCESIKGVGPKRAVELIRKHGTIEEVLKHVDGKKFTVPEDWLFNEARGLFKAPEVADPDTLEIKWIEPDEEGLIKFMCEENGFSEDRIRNGVKKLQKGRAGTTQGRLDSFFKVVSIPYANKRKAEETTASKKKAAKGGGGKYKKPK